ncbi:hydrolase TatD family protein [Tepiditoga spiralis]|uniref:Hydrolase TatD family protein n=1 Tax=Tepiditoga spiralis TaxID=2108365 RepID=A0A7G1G4H0_9BACT|nr:TatD family hydrolase [Tepiditoga spiralis]BBE29914.1 hydrolase TatD family protein [Tepiditoga spiralis]
MKLIDTHCHLTLEHFDNEREELIKELSEKFEFLFEVGIDLKSSKKTIELSKKVKNIYCSVGIHPTETENLKHDDYDEIEKLIENKKVIAIGEIGLDFHWDTDKKDQYIGFEKQLYIANKNNIPIIMHIRDAYTEAIDFLKTHNIPEMGGVVHCYSSDRKNAKKFLDMGLYLGFDGPITYPKNQELREVLKYTPIDKILPETDSPFLPPVPYRGKRNNPLYIQYVYEKISEIKQIDIEPLKEILFLNAKKLFKV